MVVIVVVFSILIIVPSFVLVHVIIRWIVWMKEEFYFFSRNYWPVTPSV